METLPRPGFGGAVEPLRIEAVGSAQQRAGLPHPRQRGELVHRGDQERRQPPVDRLVHADDRQRAVAAELALEIRADDAQFAGIVRIRQQRERLGREPCPAPGAVLERDRGRVAVRVALERSDLRARRIRPAVPLAPQDVGCRRLPHPQTDLERPRAVAPARLAPLDLQCAHQPGRPRELVQRQQPQRVAHDDADPGAGQPVVAGMPQAPEHHRDRGQAQIRLGLSAAGREEQQVHRLAVRVVRVGEAGQVQQQERELERAPARPLRSDLLPEAPAQGAGHGPVGHPEGVQQVRVLAEQRHAPRHPVGGNPRVVEQLSGRFAPVARRRTDNELLPAGLDPFAVLRHEGPERLLRRGSAVQPAERLHRQLDAGRVRRRRPLHLRRSDPRRADRPALAVDEFPLGRHAVPGGVLRRIGVVEVGDPIVPVAGVRAAQVRPRHEALLGAHLDLGLEGVGPVRLGLVRRAPVDQEARHRTRAGGQMRAARPHCVDRPFRDVKLQAVRAGNVAHDRPRAAVERDRQRLLAGSTPPDRRLAAVRFLHFRVCVVAPARGDRQLAAGPGHEKAQPDRRREERLARRLALVVRLLGQAGRFGNGVEIVVLVYVAAPVGRRPGRDQEAGDVPVRRALAARQLLGAERMARPGSDQIELDGFDEASADLLGIGGRMLGGGHGPAGTLHGAGFYARLGRLDAAFDGEE